MGLEGVPEAVLYEAALTVMMRLVFLFSPRSGTCCSWATRSTTRTTPSRRCGSSCGGRPTSTARKSSSVGYDAWSRLLTHLPGGLRRRRHDRLKLPAYGGSLFDPDRFPFLEGRRAGDQLDGHARPRRCRSTTARCCTCWKPSSAPGAGAGRWAGRGPPAQLPGARHRADRPRLRGPARPHRQAGQPSRCWAWPGLGTRSRRSRWPSWKRLAAKGEDDLLKFLKEETGRSAIAP